MRYPGAPTETLFLADCVAGRSLVWHTGMDRLPVCTVLWSERRCAAACPCCVVVSAYFVRRDDTSATDWPGGTAERCETHCVIVF